MKLIEATGSLMKALRAERGWSQRNLANRGHFSSSYIALMEVGRYSPSLETVFRLAEAFDMSATQFIESLENTLQGLEPNGLEAARHFASGEARGVAQQQGEKLLHADTVASSGPKAKEPVGRPQPALSGDA